MIASRLKALVLFAPLMLTPALAQQQGPATPPANGLKLSELLAKVETRPQFHYIDEVDWDEDGYYDITYYTSDKAKVEIKLDAVSGEPR